MIAKRYMTLSSTIERVIINANVVINDMLSLRARIVTKEFLTQCVKRRNKGLTELSEKRFFDPTMPQNRNIKITNMKMPYIRCFDGEKWVMEHRNKVVDQRWKTIAAFSWTIWDEFQDDIKADISEAWYKLILEFNEKLETCDKKTLVDARKEFILKIMNATKKIASTGN
jgi:hypothetical protein